MVTYIHPTNEEVARVGIAVSYGEMEHEELLEWVRINSDNGVVSLGMPNTPGYVITKDPDGYGLSERIPTVACFYLIGRESAIRAMRNGICAGQGRSR